MTSPEQLQPYLDGLRERTAQARRRAQERAEALRGRLPEVVALLKERFGAQRVWLFGSYARAEAGEDSDVDLLVEGIPAGQFLDACVAVDRELRDLRVDLVAREKARPEILARALEEGEEIP